MTQSTASFYNSVRLDRLMGNWDAPSTCPEWVGPGGLERTANLPQRCSNRSTPFDQEGLRGQTATVDRADTWTGQIDDGLVRPQDRRKKPTESRDETPVSWKFKFPGAKSSSGMTRRKYLPQSRIISKKVF